MKLKILVFLFSLLCIIGCSSLPDRPETTQDIQTEQTDSLPLLDVTDFLNVYRWIDPETGVEYLVLKNANDTKGFAPRYGSDGRVIVHPTDRYKTLEPLINSSHGHFQ